MEIDAFTAGVEPGGLSSTKDIKILCCYLLSLISKPVSHEQLVEALTVSGLVNYFEVASAISELLLLGNIIQDEDGYTLSPSGKQIAQTLGNGLPRSVREKAFDELNDLLEYEAKSKQINVDIEEVDSFYRVHCSLNDDYSGEIYSTTLTVPDRKTANTVRRNFINNSEQLYRVTAETLTGQSMK